MTKQYVIIPASVRLDANLSFGARLLYGEIAALASKTGRCWATNKYFAGLYEVSTRQVQNWLVELSGGKGNKKYIHIEQRKKRIITIVTGIRGEENFIPRDEENFTHNNTRDNKGILNVNTDFKLQ